MPAILFILTQFRQVQQLLTVKIRISIETLYQLLWRSIFITQRESAKTNSSKHSNDDDDDDTLVLVSTSYSLIVMIR